MAQIDIVLKHIDTRFDDMHQLMDTKFDEARRDRESLYMGQAEMLKEAKKTNGRITKLEDVTSPFRKPNRKFTLMGFVAFIAIVCLVTAWGYHNVDFKASVENRTGLEFKIDSLIRSR